MVATIRFLIISNPLQICCRFCTHKNFVPPMSTNMTCDYEHEAVLNTVSNVTSHGNSTQLEQLEVLL